jgi:UDP-N-acetylglucosamine acyltransferase
MPTIHPTALVSPDAHLADDVTVAPFAIIDAGVTIGEGCHIGPRAWITGSRTVIGSHNHIGCGAIIGDNPQDLSFDPTTPSGVILGHHNCIKDYVTIHRSTIPEGNTEIGNENFLMIGAHLGHDVHIANNNILANNVLLGGHVLMGSHIFLGGGGGFHQFIHIGDYAIVQGNASISRDVPPYCMAHGQNKLAGLNAIGLRRSGFPKEVRNDIKRAYTQLFRSGGNLREALEAADKLSWSKQAQQLLDAARTPSRKGLISR